MHPVVNLLDFFSSTLSVLSSLISYVINIQNCHVFTTELISASVAVAVKCPFVMKGCCGSL